VSEAREEVLSTASALVDAFGRHDTTAYFAHFSAEASFIFYTVPEPLTSRSAYEQLWESWERVDGFRVRSCSSLEQSVRVLGGTAVFHHRVLTEVETHNGSESLDERETIVFGQLDSGRWQAVHEHLSPSTPSDLSSSAS